MSASSTDDGTIDDEWCAHRFSHLSPSLAHSEERGGFWLLTRYEDVARVAQDWATFSSAHGITVPSHPPSIPALPEQVDPPLHQEYKRLINAYFTPSAVREHEAGVRGVVAELVDAFIERGSCDF